VHKIVLVYFFFDKKSIQSNYDFVTKFFFEKHPTIVTFWRQYFRLSEKNQQGLLYFFLLVENCSIKYKGERKAKYFGIIQEEKA